MKFCRTTPTRLLAALLALAGAPALAAPSCPVPSEIWDRPRSGRALLGEEAIRPCLGSAARDPALRVLIRHGSRGEAPLQAEELKGWLAALAIESSRVDLVNDLGVNDRVVIEVAGRK